MSILVITTGGTIGALAYPDPKNPPANSTVPPDNRDYVHEYISAQHNIHTHYAMMPHRDSKLIDESYRHHLLTLISEANETDILVTHGTDTLVETADYLHKHLSRSETLSKKRILLTGSMTPLANGQDSDGYQNLKFSLDTLMTNDAPAGVYIVLSDFADIKTQSGWQPRLYALQSGCYQKLYDPNDAQRHRIIKIEEKAQ